MAKTILVVDDDEDIREELAELIKLPGRIIMTATNPEDALRLIDGGSQAPPDHLRSQYAAVYGRLHDVHDDPSPSAVSVQLRLDECEGRSRRRAALRARAEILVRVHQEGRSAKISGPSDDRAPPREPRGLTSSRAGVSKNTCAFYISYKTIELDSAIFLWYKILQKFRPTATSAGGQPKWLVCSA